MTDSDKLTPLQRALLEAIDQLRRDGVAEVHAYGLTKILEGPDGNRRWIGYGSQYRALSQLTEHGYVAARWEDPAFAEADKRPRRRLYSMTGAGEQALRRTPAPHPVPRYVPRLASA